MSALNLARWRREMLASGIDNATKVLLVVLADNMTARGHVSVPRSRLAELMGCGPRRITERVDRAHETGWLSTVRAGKPGTTAAYVATYSDGAHVRTKRKRPDGAYIRTKHMADIQHQVVGRTSAPSATLTHGADIQPTSSTQAEPVPPKLPTVVGERQKRLDEKPASTFAECVACGHPARLGDDGLCTECFTSVIAAQRSAAS